VVINTAIKQRNSLCLASKERLFSLLTAHNLVQTKPISGF